MTNLKFSWYIIQVRSGLESSIKKKIIEQANKLKISHHFKEVLILSKEDKKNQSKKSNVIKNIMPGYMFINMNMSDSAKKLILSTPKISCFLGGKEPKKMAEKDLEKLILSSQNKFNEIDEEEKLKIGHNVQILAGPFKTFEGIIDEIHKDQIKVAIEILGNSTSITLKKDMLKKA